jgi:hypothetical protein
MIAAMNDLLIRHLLGRVVTVIDGRKPQAALPRYRGRLAYDHTSRRYSVTAAGGPAALIFRLAVVVAVDGSVITLGNPTQPPKMGRGIEPATAFVIQWPA